MNILITGATGFIGSHLIKQLSITNNSLFCTLLENEINIFGEDSVKSIVLSNYNLDENVDYLRKNNIEGIIHLASIVQSGQHNSVDVEKLIDSNIKFGTILLEIAVRAQIKWFINTGTYWQHYNNNEYSPVNLYAATKQAYMDIAKFYIDSNKIKFCTIELFDTLGPNDTRLKIFTLWDKLAKSGETLDMSPGEQIIDISYIDDIIEAYIILSQHLSSNSLIVTNGSVFVVKAEKRHTLKELAEIFEKTTNQKLKINWGGKSYRDREVMVPWEHGTVVPNWKPKRTINEAIKLTLKHKT